MPGRKYEAQRGYWYGFNGKEKDKDLNSLTAYDYGFRIYNPGIGKFLSVDPLTKKYPFYTPYQFASNTPIMSVDIDGLESSNNPNKNEEKNQFGNYSDAPTSTNGPVNLKKTDMELDPATKFMVGVCKAPFYLFVTLTETAGAAHYGDKIPKERFAEAFPLIPNDNIVKDLVVPSLTWPVQLINDLKKDPTNPDLWGQAFGAIFIGKFSKSSITTKAKITERVTVANNLFKEQGIPLNQLSGVDFLRGVKRTTLSEGTELIQWKEPGKSPNGLWFTLPNVNPSTLGIPSSYTVGHRIKLTTSVEVLESVAGFIENWERPGEILTGGGKQFTTSNIKVGSNAEVTGTFTRKN